ncbi:uncharacterized protein LOC121180251 isoform X2 [Toxotes jaculatrix]|nr:uncharacterized protein LOC121180251 isoform X2 [Toxotes jaculatrix]
MTLENNALQPSIINETSEHPPPPEGVFKLSPINLLKTGCRDCLLLRRAQHLGLGLVLLSKRRTVTDAELEEFKKQGECLDLPWTFSPNPEGGLCPEPPPEETDVMHFLVNGQRSDFLKVIETIVNSTGEPSSFFETASELS